MGALTVDAPMRGIREATRRRRASRIDFVEVVVAQRADVLAVAGLTTRCCRVPALGGTDPARTACQRTDGWRRAPAQGVLPDRRCCRPAGRARRTQASTNPSRCCRSGFRGSGCLRSRTNPARPRTATARRCSGRRWPDRSRRCRGYRVRGSHRTGCRPGPDQLRADADRGQVFSDGDLVVPRSWLPGW